MAKKKRPMRKGKALNIWIDSRLRAAIDESRKRGRRPLREEVSIALEEYLSKQGLWPVPVQVSKEPK